MKKINLILVILILIITILIVLKIHNQEIVENIKIDSEASKENLEYEVRREILYGEKSNYSEFNNEGKRVNTSEEIKKTQISEEGVEVTNFDLAYQNGYTLVNVKVQNTASETKGGYNVDLVFFNDQNVEVARLKTYLNKVEPNKETIIATTLTADIADVYRCEIQKVEGEGNE